MNLTRDEQIVQLLRDGVLYAEIGRRFGITESRVCQIAGKAGYSAQQRLDARKAARREQVTRDAALKAEAKARRDAMITDLWTAGLGTVAIGKQVGLDASYVGRIAKRLGLPQRSRGGWGSSRSASESPRPKLSPEEIRERARRAQAEAETDALAMQIRETVRCCDQDQEFRCLCGRERCEDHAFMTVDGVRCEVCMEEGAAA